MKPMTIDLYHLPRGVRGHASGAIGEWKRVLGGVRYHQLQLLIGRSWSQELRCGVEANSNQLLWGVLLSGRIG